MIEIKIKVAGETVAEAVTELVKAVGEQNEELQALLAAANPPPVVAEAEPDNPEGVTIDEVRTVMNTCRAKGINIEEMITMFAPKLHMMAKADYHKLLAMGVEALERHEAAQQVKERKKRTSKLRSRSPTKRPPASSGLLPKRQKRQKLPRPIPKKRFVRCWLRQEQRTSTSRR